MKKRKLGNSNLEVSATPSDLQEIDAAVSKITPQGARFPESLLKMMGL